MKRLALCLVPVLILGVAVAVATAQRRPNPFPHPGDDSIVVPKSIGDVRVVTTLADAKQRWKGNPRCGFSPVFSKCQWGSKTSPRGFAIIAAQGGREDPVNFVEISAGFAGTRAITGGANEFIGWDTREGIGLFSKASDVERRLGGEESRHGFVVNGPASSMEFVTDGSAGEKLVTAIILNAKD